MGLGPVPATEKLLARTGWRCRRPGRGRAERGVRRAEPRRDPPAQAGRGPGQRRRRRDRARPPARLLRRPAAGHPARPAGARGRPARPGHPVRRRRPGRLDAASSAPDRSSEGYRRGGCSRRPGAASVESGRRGDVLQPHLAAGDQPLAGVADLHRPQLLQPAAVDRQPGGGQPARPGPRAGSRSGCSPRPPCRARRTRSRRRCWPPSRSPSCARRRARSRTAGGGRAAGRTVATTRSPRGLDQLQAEPPVVRRRGCPQVPPRRAA